MEMFGIGEVSKMVGVSPQTIKNWCVGNLIPQPTRVGLKRVRRWNYGQLALILRFAEGQGYQIQDPYKSRAGLVRELTT